LITKIGMTVTVTQPVGSPGVHIHGQLARFPALALALGEAGRGAVAGARSSVRKAVGRLITLAREARHRLAACL
jgi:hypothetical protein